MKSKFKELNTMLFISGGWKPLILSLFIQCTFFIIWLLSLYFFILVARDNQVAVNKYADIFNGILLLVDIFVIFIYIGIFLAFPVIIYTYSGFKESLKDCSAGRGFSCRQYLTYSNQHFISIKVYLVFYVAIFFGGFIYFFSKSNIF